MFQKQCKIWHGKANGSMLRDELSCCCQGIMRMPTWEKYDIKYGDKFPPVGFLDVWFTFNSIVPDILLQIGSGWGFGMVSYNMKMGYCVNCSWQWSAANYTRRYSIDTYTH